MANVKMKLQFIMVKEDWSCNYCIIKYHGLNLAKFYLLSTDEVLKVNGSKLVKMPDIDISLRFLG